MHAVMSDGCHDQAIATALERELLFFKETEEAGDEERGDSERKGVKPEADDTVELEVLLDNTCSDDFITAGYKMIKTENENKNRDLWLLKESSL